MVDARGLADVSWAAACVTGRLREPAACVNWPPVKGVFVSGPEGPPELARFAGSDIGTPPRPGNEDTLHGLGRGASGTAFLRVREPYFGNGVRRPRSRLSFFRWR